MAPHRAAALLAGTLLSGSLAAARTHEPPRRVSASAAGQALYRSECAGCHGERGDGQGLADPAMLPRPRDFTRGKFKLRSTDPRKPISDLELFRTITDGMPGTAMVSFRFLSAAERRALVGAVRALAKLDDSAAAEPVSVPPRPPTTRALLAEGKYLYDELGCASCHGAGGEGNGVSASQLKDEWDDPDPPRDLTRDRFRGGETGRDVYLRLTLGMPGTPMPGYADVSDDAQRWAVVAYLESLRRPPPPPPEDPVARGRQVLAEHWCLACHRLAGAGGAVGPSLDTAMRKLRFDWIRQFLSAPRAEGKIYPGYVQRMPELSLEPPEIEALLRYLAAAVRRPYPGEPATPAPATAQQIEHGRFLYMARCLACHALGPLQPPRPPRWPGPDLARAARRLEYGLLLSWTTAPRLAHPQEAMPLPDMTAGEIEAVRAFIWERGNRVRGEVRRPSTGTGSAPAHAP